MPHADRRPPRRPHARPFAPKHAPLLETLEARRLMAASDFGGAGTAIRFPEAAAAFPSATGVGQTIAVIDSGIDYTHPSLGGSFGPAYKVVGGYDFVDDDADPLDTYGHGTEVAGVIAGSAAIDQSNSYQGIAPQAKLVALRIDGDGTSPVPDSRIEQALQWVVAHRTEFGITVVNISYGAGDYNSPTSSSIYGDELSALRDSGVTVVAAAGNEGVTPAQGINTPAADPGVISVGSVGLNNQPASFSQRGPVLTLLAPGEEVLSTLSGGGYGLVEGTSFSAPIVAGAVALMHNVDGALSPADAMSILRASGIATFDGGPRDGTNTRLIYPRLDLKNALSLTLARKPGTTAQQSAVGRNGNQNALAVDSQGVTHFVYYDAGTDTMAYATRSAAGQWSPTQTVDATLPFQGYYLSMAVDTLGQPAVAYFDGTNGDLKYARNTGSQWEITTIDSRGSTGIYPSLVFDRNGLALISYYRKTSGDLRVANRDFDGNWTITSVDTAGNVGRSTTAALAANGRVGVAYEDSTHGWLEYAEFDPRKKRWAHTAADKSTRGIAFPSLAFSTDTDAPYVSYYDGSPANLKVATFAARAWTSQTVAARGATGLYTALFFAGADAPHVAYWDKSQNQALLAEYDGSTWTSDRLKSAGGRFLAGVLDRTAQVFRYAYYDGTGLKVDLVDES